MAQIPPEMQRSLDKVVLSFVQVCQQIRGQATEASLAVAELKAEFDEDLAASLQRETAAAIDKARA